MVFPCKALLARIGLGGFWLAATAVSLLNSPVHAIENPAFESLKLQGASTSAFMPLPEDYMLLWWADGPPSYLGSQAPPASETLCLQSGRWGLAIDTRHMRVRRFGDFAKPVTLTEAMQPGRRGLDDLPTVAWDCAVVRAGRRFACAGHARPNDEFFQPVRFVESGHFFARVMITDLKFADESGHEFASPGRLEISAWPDRLAFRLDVDSDASAADGMLELRVGDQRASAPLGSKTVWLRLEQGTAAAPNARVEAAPPLAVNFDEGLQCHTVSLPEQPWSNAKGTYYPEEHLDRLDRWPLTVVNDSDRPALARLMFTQQQHLPITGFTPLLCDPDGTPTGIPVQISKNWHRRPDKGSLPHEGPWFHGCALVRLPPHSRREFRFSMAYARYGGVFAASHAQLCLIGWGHNQFWDQAAIGSFGESICFEPGRVQRRCFIDDIRPLLTLPQAGPAKPWGWAGNCGGGDFLVWQDAQGRYPGFRATRTDYRAYGPCLTAVTYSEESAGGELSARMDVSLPRSDDYLRTFFQLRYDVHRPIQWQRLAFFQLGADFYNETPSRKAAIGDAQGLVQEWEPTRAKDQVDRPPVPLSGPQPWLSIHALAPDLLRAGGAAASRGLIVRQWRATLGGKTVPVPFASSWCTEWGQGNHRTVLELSPPPDLHELMPGDFVEAQLELVVFPSNPAAYYGPNNSFRAALDKDADTRRLVRREAAGNDLRIRPLRGRLNQSYPVEMAVDADQTAEADVTGGVAYVPMTFSGLTQPRGYALRLDNRRVDQSVHGNDFWQTDYDPVTQRWRMTFNLPLGDPTPGLRKLRFALEPVGR